MRSRVVSAAATLAFMAALSFTLTSCGGGDDGSGKIKGAEEGKSSASPSDEHSSKARSDKRPNIELPADMTYRFDWGDAGSKDKEDVLHDTEQFIKAVDMAIAHQKPLDKAYQYYSEGPAAAESEDFIQTFVDNKNRITGFRRFYNARVHIKSKKAASVVYCEDQTRAFNRSIKAGKVDKTKPSKDDYVIYSGQLKLNDEGVWVTMKLLSHRGSAECLP